jgi:hypothetical protein
LRPADARRGNRGISDFRSLRRETGTVEVDQMIRYVAGKTRILVLYVTKLLLYAGMLPAALS